MKLNAAAEMLPITWPEFGKLHPFAPLKQARGYQTIFKQLEDWLGEITGFAGDFFAAQCGFAGGIRRVARPFARITNIAVKRIAILFDPTSAHGTNPRAR